MQPGGAAPTAELTDDLAGMWKTVLQTPTDQNPFANPDNPNAIRCWQLGGNVVAPFGPAAGGVFSCTVKGGTWIFVAGYSGEWNTLEAGSQDCPTSVLAAAPRRQTKTVKSVTVDGQRVALSYV